MLGYTHNEIPDPAYACSLACRSNLNVNRGSADTEDQSST